MISMSEETILPSLGVTESPFIQVIWAHPRTDSLTASIAQDVIDELTSFDCEVDVLDLYREGFNPVLDEPDEPDWENIDKRYSDEVMDHAKRTKSAEAVVFVFPVWWYSVPAILKGYIDRVWNNGLFYGQGRRADLIATRWIALAGESKEAFKKRDYDKLIEHQLNVGIAGLCGVHDSRVELLYNTVGEDVSDRDAHFIGLHSQARQIAADLVYTVAERSSDTENQSS